MTIIHEITAILQRSPLHSQGCEIYKINRGSALPRTVLESCLVQRILRIVT